MEKEIWAHVGEYVQIRRKDGKYIIKQDGYIIKTTTSSFTFKTKCDISGQTYKNQIKYKDVTGIKYWKKPICPLCKSTEIKDFSKSSWDGPNEKSHIITCCICVKCGIFFINKNDKDQCLWNY